MPSNLKVTQYGDMATVVEDVTPDTKQTDGATGEDETEYQNTNWSKQFGYYCTLPECKISVDTLVRWDIGDGFKADPYTTAILDHISGFGHDTFDDILENQDKVSLIGGDSFAEVMRDPETNILLNLKPLDPSSVKIIADGYGILKRYEQVSRVKGKANKKFKIEQIFHLTNCRVADSIHGISVFDAVEKIILASNENFSDMKQLMHRFVRPRFLVGGHRGRSKNQYIRGKI